MSSQTYTRIYLQERPTGDITATTFNSESLPLSSLEPADGQVLVKAHWLSLDPAMRGWINDSRSYIPPVQIGETMRAGGLATVIKAGPGSALAPGDMISGRTGWAEYALLREAEVQKIE